MRPGPSSRHAQGALPSYLGHCASLRDCGLAFEWLRANCNVPISVSRVGMVEKTFDVDGCIIILHGDQRKY